MSPYASALHDGAEIGTFELVEVVVESVVGLLLGVDLVGYGELDLAQHPTHVVHIQ